MGFEPRYYTAKGRLLADETICTANREVFRTFFEFEEYKLKRKNGLPMLDEGCYRTLYGYIQKLRNVNRWFGNRPWRDLTRKQIKRVYDDLEDGRIKNACGEPFKDRSSYYNKIFKSKPFRIVGKSELAKDVVEYATESSDREVHYVSEDVFERMVSAISNPTHLLLFWLAWDIGENIGSLLQLQKKDFRRQVNGQTREPEYLVTLPKSKLKRSRRARTEPTLYPQTVRYADIVLESLGAEDRLFPFGHRQALKIIHGVVKRTNATCMPNNDPVRWKDLRSGMACHLLKKGWSREEVDARLGHTPQSKALNAYINYLALARQKPKKRMFDSSLEKVQNELEEAKRREKLSGERLRRVQEENELLRNEFVGTRRSISELQAAIKLLRTA